MEEFEKYLVENSVSNRELRSFSPGDVRRDQARMRSEARKAEREERKKPKVEPSHGVEFQEEE